MRNRLDDILATVGRVLGTTTEPMEELTLPEPAATLWLETHEVVERTFAQHGGCRLGGGTLLAARWSHRVSVDIDLTIEPAGPRPPEIRNLLRGDNPFRKELERLGCGEPSAPSAHHIRIPFNESTLDISVLDAHPAAGEHRALVNGKSAVVLSTTQILGGKLTRPEQLLHRDAYDIRHAAHFDRQSLAEAFNGVNRSDAEQIVAIWNKLDGRWSAIAAGQLRNVVPTHSYDPGTLAVETAHALRNALYEHVRITTRGREGTFHAETAGNTIVQVAFTRRTLEKTLREHGIEDYLRSRSTGIDSEEVLKRVKKACRFGAKPQTVYETTHKAPPPDTPGARTTGPENSGWPARLRMEAPPRSANNLAHSRDTTNRGASR